MVSALWLLVMLCIPGKVFITSARIHALFPEMKRGQRIFWQLSQVGRWLKKTESTRENKEPGSVLKGGFWLFQFCKSVVEKGT